MAKNFLNDIRPAGHAEKRERIDSEPLLESTRTVQLPPRFREKNFSSDYHQKPRKLIWTIAALVIVIGTVVVMNIFSSASITITPKSEDVSLDKTDFSASLAGDSKTISFKIIKISGSSEKVVTGGTPTTVLTKATGKVVIYNNFSTAPQKLAIETRLNTTDGKIFKTDTALTVPGTKIVGGKVTPGQIEASVHADQPGSTYNIALSDFNILGFKGTPKYDKMYARSKTIMSGGASGQGIALSEADARVAHEAALGILRDKLVAEAKASLPESSVLLTGSYVIREDSDSGQTVSGKNVMIVKGSMYGILFNEAEFSKKIAETSIGQYDGADIFIPKISSLTIDLKNKETISDTTSNISFSVSGQAKVVWQIPKSEILKKLLGAKKKNIATSLSSFESIENVTVDMFPPWSMKLPSKEKSVKLIVVDQS